MYCKVSIYLSVNLTSFCDNGLLLRMEIIDDCPNERQEDLRLLIVGRPRVFLAAMEVDGGRDDPT